VEMSRLSCLALVLAVACGCVALAASPELSKTVRSGEARLRRGVCGDFEWMLDMDSRVMTVFNDDIVSSESYTIRECNVSEEDAPYIKSLVIDSTCEADVSIDDKALMLFNASVRSIVIFGCLKSIGKDALGWDDVSYVFYDGISAPSCESAFNSDALTRVCVGDTYPSSSFCEKPIGFDCVEAYSGSYSDSSNPYIRKGRCGDFDFAIDYYDYYGIIMTLYRENFTPSEAYTISDCGLGVYESAYISTIEIVSRCDVDVSIDDYALAFPGIGRININGCIKSIGDRALGGYYLEEVNYEGNVSPSCKKAFSSISFSYYYGDWLNVCVDDDYPSYSFCEKRAVKDCYGSHSEDSSDSGERKGLCGDFEWTLDPQTGIMVISREDFEPSKEYVIGECDIYWRDIEYVQELVIESSCDAKVRIEDNALNFYGVTDITIRGCLESVGQFSLGSSYVSHVVYEGFTVPSCEFAFSGKHPYHVCVNYDYPGFTFCEVPAMPGCDTSTSGYDVDSSSFEGAPVSVKVPCAPHIKIYRGKALYEEYFAMLDENKSVMCVNAQTEYDSFLARCDILTEDDRCTYVDFRRCELSDISRRHIDKILPSDMEYERGPFVKNCPGGGGVCNEYCGREVCFYVNASNYYVARTEKYYGTYIYEWHDDEPSIEKFTAEECGSLRLEPPEVVCHEEPPAEPSSATKTSIQALLVALLLLL